MANVLIAAADGKVREEIKRIVARLGHAAHEADCSFRALGILYRADIDIALVAAGSGIDVLADIKNEMPRLPVIALTSRGGEEKLRAFSLGADDVLEEGCELSELALRIKALLRRASITLASKALPDEIHVNPCTRTVTVGGRTMNLPKKEFQLLKVLLSKAGKVFNRSELMD